MPRVSGRNRRDELLEAAKELIFTEGMSRCTVRRLAEIVGITEAAVYRHFVGKEELLLALLTNVFATWQSQIAALHKEPTSAETRLLKLGDIHLQTLLKAHFNPILLLSDASDPERTALRTALRQQAEALFAAILALVKEGQRTSEFPMTFSPKIAAGACMGAIQHAVMHWTLTNSSVGLAGRMRKTLRCLLSAFRGPSTEAGARKHPYPTISTNATSSHSRKPRTSTPPVRGGKKREKI
jgi:AcrR family transcriptional regulator